MATRRVRLRSPRLIYDVEMLRAMADDTRLQILQFLCTPGAGEMKAFAVNEIADNFELTASTVSHHLQLLRQARLVNVKRDGKNRLYSLNWDTMRRSVGQFNDLLNLIDQATNRAAQHEDGDED